MMCILKSYFIFSTLEYQELKKYHLENNCFFFKFELTYIFITIINTITHITKITSAFV